MAGAAGLGTTITQTLVGTFAGLIMVIVVGAMLITAEYRRGLIRTTLAASPRRGRVLAAKAIVIGAASAVRDSASAIGIVLGLLYLFPIVAQMVSDPHWRRHLQQIGPMTAGLAIQATTNLHSLPIGPWYGRASACSPPGQRQPSSPAGCWSNCATGEHSAKAVPGHPGP